MQLKRIFITLVSILMLTYLFSCNNHQNTKPYSVVKPRPSMDTNEIKKYLAEYDKGKVVFKNYCSACHGAPGRRIDGPSFDGLFDRLPAPGQEYFVRFISDERALRESGDKYVRELEKEYNSVSIDHQFKDSLSPEDLSNLIVYMRLPLKDGSLRR